MNSGAKERKPLETVDPADLLAVDSGRSDLNIMEIEEAFNGALESLPEIEPVSISNNS